MDPTQITLEYLRRLLIVSFLIYVVSFLIKQYSVQKHLQAVNKHRANTLNSYKLFIQSLENADSGTKQSLMVEIARAIYESGQTGYINSKDDSGGIPSILEITKMVNKG